MVPGTESTLLLLGAHGQRTALCGSGERMAK